MADSNVMGRTPSNSREGGGGTSSGRSTLIGLVRNLSRSGKGRESRQASSRYGDVAGNSASTSSPSGGYRLVSPNRAPSSSYTTSNLDRGKKEKIVWGPPPANVEGYTSRRIEGVELVDDGPQITSSSRPVQSKSKKPQKQSDESAVALPPPYSTALHDPVQQRDNGKDRTERSATIPDRRSIDSLFSSLDLPAEVGPRRSSTLNHSANVPRRAFSQRAGGLKSRNSVSSTARAKPAREAPVPLGVTSPFQGYWTTGRSNNEEDQVDYEDLNKLREKFRGSNSIWTVSRGWKKGIFASFEEAEQQTRGFPGPIIRQFETVEEAIEFLQSPSSTVASRPGPITNAEDDSSTGARFAGSLQRQNSQRQTSGTNSPGEELRRNYRSPQTNPFKSPNTNPFLTESDGPSLTTGGSFDNHRANGTLSPSPLRAFSSPTRRSPLKSPMKEYPTILEDGLTNKESILPPPAIDMSAYNYFDKAGISTNTQANGNVEWQSAGVVVLPMISCQDLEPGISFYKEVLGFHLLNDQREKGQVTLSHRDSPHRASIILRARFPPSTNNLQSVTNSSKIPLSMYRSSIVLDQGQCDMERLHVEMTKNLLQFQSVQQQASMGARRSSLGQMRVEEIEKKPWGSSEFVIIDMDGNMILITGTSSSHTSS